MMCHGKLSQSTPELHPVPVVSPWHHIGIDFIGPISPASHQGNRYILTITDYFTNFVEEILMKRKYFENVAAALFKIVKHMHYGEVLKLMGI